MDNHGHSTGVAELRAEFRSVRRTFEAALRRLGADGMTTPIGARDGGPVAGAWVPREVVIHIAAWLREAGERIPALMAGVPSREYDADAFNTAAVAAARDWSPALALAAYTRAADRFEAIAADLTDDDLDEEPDVRAWLESAARVLITEHLHEVGRRAAE